ncbi:MAG: MFS family permease [Pseudohongiellaceae bacterium]|jgi:MFS family permease
MSTPKSSQSTASANANAGKSPPYPHEGYAWYVVGILMIVYVFSFMDRQILALLVDPIKADLNISDSQISYLGGFAFALFYTVFGIPIARMADSKNRKVIISVGLATWSLFTMLCGTANRFFSFAVFRMGVGVGEATLSPSAYSMITDMFRPERMAIAISIYSAGIYIGTGLSSVFGGLVIGYAESLDNLTLPFVGAVEPWQYVFFAIGFPGLLFTLVMLTVKEPVRRANFGAGASAQTSIPFNQVVDYIRANRKTFIYHNVGFALCSFISYGGAYWIPSYLIRIHELTRQEAGLYYGTIVMVFGTAGIIFGGWLSGRMTINGQADSKLKVGMLAAMLHIPFGIIYPLMPDANLALLFLCPAVFTAAMPFGVAPAAIQQMMPARMRAQGAAVYLFVINLIGLGLGPTAVAWCTDYVYGDPNEVHLSLLWVSTIFGVLAAFLLWKARAHFKNSLHYLKEYEEKG